MGSFVKRRGWLVALPVLAIGVASWRLGSWESGLARRQAAEAAGIPESRVELRDGLNVHLSGFATAEERDAAVARVAALRSSWGVTGDLVAVPGPGADIALGSSTTADGGAATPLVPATTAPAGTAPVSSAPSATVAATAATPTTSPPPATSPPATTPTAGSAVTAPASGAELAAALSGLGPVGFDPGATAPREADGAVLERAAALLKADTSGRVVRVVGHTDTDGARVANQRLSLLRARAVVARLVEAGVPPARLEAVGAGEDDPAVSPELGPADKERNRRISWVVGS